MAADSIAHFFLADTGAPACVVRALTPPMLAAWQEATGGAHAAWVATNHFTAAADTHLLLPDGAGGLAQVLLGLGDTPNPFACAHLPPALPSGAYRLAKDTPAEVAAMAALAWGLGCYRFEAYKTSPKTSPQEKTLPQFVAPAAQIENAVRLCRAIYHTRDLINTPACDMLPSALAAAFTKLAERYDAQPRIIVGDDLLHENFNLIHAVGRAAGDAPRLLDLHWGQADAPAITLIGKGVCFDSGGLNLKPGAAMDLMKKDMAGAAVAMGLAEAIMDARLPVRLRLLVGAVENAIGANAFRPGDVVRSHKGISVEIGNTDAEGRLILADMLSAAALDTPDLILDFATLTGAARVALGPQIVPFYTRNDTLAAALCASADATHDPIWRLPLWAGYDDWLKSEIADVNHIATSPMAGSVTAALFLARFVDSDSWAHFDLYGWQAKASAGHPVGGAAQCLRGVFHYLEQHYGARDNT